MGCGGSKKDVQTAPPPQAKETKQEKERPRPKSAPQENKAPDKSKDSDDSTGGKGNDKTSKKDLRQELLQATDSRDLERLEKAIAEYDRHQLPNDADLARARRVLIALHEEELQAAIKARKLEDLEAAIESANNSVVSVELHEGETLKEAEELRKLLRRLKLYLHKVLELKPMTVSEIHSYQRPRPLVHAVMKATYLLLGEQERLLQQWEYIQSLLRRQGRGSIIRRIKDFDLQHMKQAKVHRAEGHLRHCNKDKVRQTSAGAGTFYVWSYNIIKDGKSGEKEKT